MVDKVAASEKLEREYLAAVIGAGTVLDDFPLRSEDFYDLRHRAIFDACVFLRENDSPTQLSELLDRLESSGKTAAAGGEQYVCEVSSLFVSDPKHQQRRLRELKRLRDIREDALRVLEACNKQELDRAESLMVESTEKASQADEEVYSLFDIEASALEVMAGKRKRVRTGVKFIDMQVGHISAGDLVVIGADTGVGKTSCMVSMAMVQAERLGQKCGFISCEDSKDSLGAKFLSYHSGLEMRALRDGSAMRSTATVEAAMRKAAGIGISFAFPVGGDDIDVTKAMSALVRKHKCECLFVDYVQTINASGAAENRREDVRRIASRIKGHAARLEVPVVLASQLRRRTDRQDRRPSKHDLKETGDLENMAELIVLLWNEGDPNRVEACIDKSKWGGGGVFGFRRRGGMLEEV